MPARWPADTALQDERVCVDCGCIQEKAQQVFLNEELRLPVDSQPAQSIVVTNKLGTVKNDQATILSGAGSETSVIASIKKNQSSPRNKS